MTSISTNGHNDVIARTDIQAAIALATLSENIGDSLTNLLKSEIESFSATAPALQRLPAVERKASLAEALDQADVIEGAVWTAIADTQVPAGKEREVMLRAGRVSHFLKAVHSLQTNLQDIKARQSTALTLQAGDNLTRTFKLTEDLLRRANAVRDYTELWAILDKAWSQRREDASTLAEAIWASDAVVHSLYESVEPETTPAKRDPEAKDLRVRVSGQLLLTVFYESRLETQVFDAPVLFIVAPYWGHTLVWNWLAFAHEIGHHVWKNIRGEGQVKGKHVYLPVSDELFVHLTAYLLTKPLSVRKLWIKWAPELFADVYDALQIGPAAVHSMQHMFFALPPKALSEQLLPPPHHADWLLRSADDDHPMPYLRILLSLEVLKLLDDPIQPRFTQECADLRQEMDQIFASPPTKLFTRESTEGIPIEEMMAVGRDVIKIVLETPLFALGKKSVALNNPLARRTIRDVFLEMDVDKVQTARALVEARDWDHCRDGLLNGDFKVQHLLAALQYEFERLTARGGISAQGGQFEELSRNAIKTLGEYGKQRLHLGLIEKKQSYYQDMAA
jgi:hypothetical protein